MAMLKSEGRSLYRVCLSPSLKSSSGFFFVRVVPFPKCLLTGVDIKAAQRFSRKSSEQIEIEQINRKTDRAEKPDH